MYKCPDKFKVYCLIFLTTLFHLLFINVYCDNDDEITMKIKGIGNHYLFTSSIKNAVKAIYINKKLTDKSLTNMIYLEEDENEIKVQFDLSQINSLDKFFQNCNSITYIDLSNFHKKSIIGMWGMFMGCTSLISINFKNFDTSNVKYMENMFKDCNSLISLDLSFFNYQSVININDIFSGCNSLSFLNLSNSCFSDTISIEDILNVIPQNLIVCLEEKYLEILEQIDKCITYYCDNNWKNIKKYINDGNNHCNLLCEKNLYQYNEKCFEKCPNNTVPKVNMCIENENTYSNIISENNNKNSINNSVSNNINKIHNSNYKSDITIIYRENSDYQTNILSDKLSDYPIYVKNEFKSNYIKTSNLKINEIKITHITNTNSEYFQNSIDKNNSTDFLLNKSISFEISYEDKYFINLFHSGNIKLLLTNIDNENFMKQINNKKYYISKLSNQEKHNNSIIDIGNCSYLLKVENQINDIEELVLAKIETKFEGINIPIIEYEVYNKEGIKLNLDICKDINISYFIPIEINENEIFKYDPQSNFYNNRCNKYTTENDTDITIYDRKNEFNNKNLSLCERNCTFRKYDTNNSKVQCDCRINPGLNRLEKNQIDLLTKLESNKSITNVDVIKCSEILTSTKELKSNPGFFLLILILVVFIVIFIIFSIKGYVILKNNIDKVIYKRFKNENKNCINKNNKKNILNKNNFIEKKTGKKKSRTKKKRKSPSKNLSLKSKSNLYLNTKNDISDNDKKINLEIKLKLYETDYELNNCKYIDAKRFDKRSSCDYYCSLLKSKQIFIFTFFNFEDNNSGIIKKFMLFLSFALHYTINALFFNDITMHQIFIDQGKYNINYQFPFIIISAVLSVAILRIILIGLILTDKDIFEIKCQSNISKAKALKKNILKKIKIKFTIFFILIFLLLILFWYYLTCWNAIYENTQLYLIKNTLISFGISLIYPFIINIIPVLLRKHSLKGKGKKYLYNASKIMQLL